MKLVLLIHYQNQTQINWLTWDSKPLGALPKKALHSVSSLSHQLCIKQNSAGQCCRLKPIIYAAWKVIFPNQSWAIPYSALSFLSLFFFNFKHRSYFILAIILKVEKMKEGRKTASKQGDFWSMALKGNTPVKYTLRSGQQIQVHINAIEGSIAIPVL